MSTVADHILPPPASVQASGKPTRAPGSPHANARSAMPSTLSAASTAERGIWWVGAFAALAWTALVLVLVIYFWLNKPVGFSDWAFTDKFAVGEGAVAVALMVLAVAPGALGPVGRRLRPAGPWLAAVALVLQVWEVFTAKLGMLLTPFFAPPKSLVEVHVTDWARLLGVGIAPGGPGRLCQGLSSPALGRDGAARARVLRPACARQAGAGERPSGPAPPGRPALGRAEARGIGLAGPGRKLVAWRR